MDAKVTNYTRWQSDVIVDLIKRYKFPYITMNPGASFRGLHDSLVNYGNNDPPMLLCQHEEIAVQIAHGYAKASGKPMAVILHNLVGLLHATMAIYYAYIDRVPIFIMGATGPMDDLPATRVGKYAVWLHQPRPVASVPGFSDGDVSVQDGGAQLAALWLDAKPGMRVLDACAAPGGKTAQLAELGATDLTALDVDATRIQRIDENLRRGKLTARVLVGDAAHPDAWLADSGGSSFDRILLDAPCTASGIVRRHPDIPWLRRPADVAQLTKVQRELLDALWPLLKVGGRLLYVVCSLFPDEGREQIARFGERQPNACRYDLPASQLLPVSVAEPAAVAAWQGSDLPTLHDGFFYALLEKTG